MNNKWNMIVDVARCENCHNCTLSVKDEHVGNDFPGYAAPQPAHGENWINIGRKVRGSGHATDVAYLPTMCNHCDNAPCLEAGKSDGAVRKRPDGIVIIDPVKAVGRRDLVDSCPYGGITWNEELSLPQIWIFDAHLLDAGWTEPRASHACPTQALEAVKLSDREMNERVEREGLRVLRPELGTKPRVFYKNLHRFDKCFVAGSVVEQCGELTELVEGAEVRLSSEGQLIATTRSDTFGDFKFDGLEPGSGTYVVEVSAGGSEASVEVVIEESVAIGEILLSGVTKPSGLPS